MTRLKFSRWRRNRGITFALDEIAYRNRRVSIVWDRNGDRYGFGKGLHILVDGKKIASSARLREADGKASGRREDRTQPQGQCCREQRRHLLPARSRLYTAPGTSVGRLVDGNYWYHRDPPNRWTCEGSPNAKDWVEIDFGISRPIGYIALYFLDDGKTIIPPKSYDLEFWDGSKWAAIPGQVRQPSRPVGRRVNRIFIGKGNPIRTTKIRAIFTHAPGGKTGLTEIEAADAPKQ